MSRTAVRTVSRPSSTRPMGAASAVLLDVVYNHLGPSGNYLPEFGPYFTDVQSPRGARR